MFTAIVLLSTFSQIAQDTSNTPPARQLNTTLKVWISKQTDPVEQVWEIDFKTNPACILTFDGTDWVGVHPNGQKMVFRKVATTMKYKDGSPFYNYEIQIGATKILPDWCDQPPAFYFTKMKLVPYLRPGGNGVKGVVDFRITE